MIPPYPLCWPDGLPRRAPERRTASQFRATLAAATKNVATSLQGFGKDSGKPVTETVATSNVGARGIDLGGGGTERPNDPGVAVWFKWEGELRCVAVDRYLKPEENLQAIHHILEARRTELRHGGLIIAKNSFKGFVAALPAPGKRTWRSVFGWREGAVVNAAQVESQYRELAKKRHPDAGGSVEDFKELGRAKAEALAEIGN